jgi:hypothetical protein
VYIVILISVKKYAIDMQLHMTVKALATLQGEIKCKKDELIKKTNLFQGIEGEAENYLLEMISDNLKELENLFAQRKTLYDQIENLKKTETDLIKETAHGSTS